MAISARLAKVFVNMSKLLSEGRVDTGPTGNGLPKVDFKAVDDDGKTRTFTIIKQNSEKLTTPAKLERDSPGAIWQVRDDDRAVLMGHVDLKRMVFNSYDAIPTVVDADAVLADLDEDEMIGDEEIRVTGSRTPVPQPSEIQMRPKRPPQAAGERPERRTA